MSKIAISRHFFAHSGYENDQWNDFTRWLNEISIIFRTQVHFGMLNSKIIDFQLNQSQIGVLIQMLKYTYYNIDQIIVSVFRSTE